ncbi:Bug family tripartite tricarboxylate transporter substrate binding protein [Falsiroseomonas selenitidurans]|uniref:Tripartite tricarboxylate transporter substrate binding protein n=1 Tax=Falsiroseomonas selenitidurans TaxID=2716335 RepID=A0ABX1E0P2_9PROT|nr:tripartite tricarboxylate transporter substrate binding protein [Falsiroseomonas selenitidurans]NKC30663.1 tripartite tricarboxylate transporter substrate binding protein [Falsiroseomonas selenitidurans]
MTKTWSIGRRGLLAAGGAGLAAPGLLVRPASAQAAWPAQPVRMVVPFAAGGPTDVPARLLAEEMSKVLPNRVVVENRTGSGVVIGTDVVAKGPQDGSMLLYSTVAHAVTRAMFPTLPFDPIADFTPCALVGQVPVILLVNNDFPARTLAEFIAVLRANPGKYDYASSGNGGAVHLATELFLHAAGGLKVNHIPYRGSSAALPDVLSGRVPMIFDIAASALPYARSGQLRALGISTKTRSPLAPTIPTMIEQGVAGYEAYTWHMVFARSGTPAPVIQAVNRAVNAAVNVPAVKDRLLGFAMQVVSDSTPDSAAAYLRSEIGVWEPLVRAAGIRAS